MSPTSFRSSKNRCAQRAERGVVLLFCLIALIVMLIGSVALVRSFNTTLFTAGNVAFKRDLQNQGERAVAVALAAVAGTGPLVTPDARSQNRPANNYSATILPTNAQGIPTALLLSATDFDAAWTAPAVPTTTGQGVTIRYVIDRLCDSTGLDSALGSARCQIVDNGPSGGSGSHLNVAEDASAGGAGASSLQIVYRVSVRVDGPRDTQAFFQTTFTM
jgi:type IV pilus assembly protein PilX